MAGLLAAQSLADFFDTVTVVACDPLPDADAVRRGVPQGRHLHALLARRAQVIEELFRASSTKWSSTVRSTSTAGSVAAVLHSHGCLTYTSIACSPRAEYDSAALNQFFRVTSLVDPATRLRPGMIWHAARANHGRHLHGIHLHGIDQLDSVAGVLADSVAREPTDASEYRHLRRVSALLLGA